MNSLHEDLVLSRDLSHSVTLRKNRQRMIACSRATLGTAAVVTPSRLARTTSRKQQAYHTPRPLHASFDIAQVLRLQLIHGGSTYVYPCVPSPRFHSHDGSISSVLPPRDERSFASTTSSLVAPNNDRHGAPSTPCQPYCGLSGRFY